MIPVLLICVSYFIIPFYELLLVFIDLKLIFGAFVRLIKAIISQTIIYRFVKLIHVPILIVSKLSTLGRFVRNRLILWQGMLFGFPIVFVYYRTRHWLQISIVVSVPVRLEAQVIGSIAILMMSLSLPSAEFSDELKKYKTGWRIQPNAIRSQLCAT